MSEAFWCVIPAYDAGATIARVVDDVRRHAAGIRVVVVDDGSRDGTFDAASSAADHVIRFPSNRGKGAALRAGFAHALNAGAHGVLTLDADGQHDAASAPALLAALADFDIVIGARARAGAMPLQRRLSNALSTFVVDTLARCRVADSQSGFRAFRRGVLERVHADGDRYEFETELLIRAGRAGFRIGMVPVATIYEGERSHFLAVHDTARVVRTLWRLRAGAGR